MKPITTEEKIINQCIKILKVKPADIQIIERFLGGMSNYTYHVKVKNNYYVTRIIGEGGEVFVNRIVEYAHLSMIDKLNITPPVVYFDTFSGFKITHYIKGQVLSQNLTSNDLQLVANTLHKLHSIDTKGAYDYALFERLSYYQSLVKSNLSSQYYTLLNELTKLYETKYYQYKKVFCHGDAQRSNIVISDNQAYLLDFEFAGLNDAYYDIASFGNINLDDALDLLAVYLGKTPNQEEVKRLWFNRFYQVLQWHIVALIKHEIGLSDKLKIAFDVVSQKYLTIAQTLYEKIIKD